MKYQVKGIPASLKDVPQVKKALMAAEAVETIAERDDWVILPVAGDCMEAAGIEDGGWVAVDFTHMPRPPKYGDGGYQDACLCLAVWPGQTRPAVMAKAYTGKWGPVHTVATMYDNTKGSSFRLNVGLFAEKIYGVIFASWGRDGLLKWQKDTEGFPTALPSASTIQGINVGEPEIIRASRKDWRMDTPA